MLPELTTDELSAAYDAVAAELVARLPADTVPPVDALALARALGLAVAWDDRQSGRGRIARLSRRGGAAAGSILLRPDPRRERLQWAIAHEIGEFTTHRAFERLGVDPREAPPAARESVANALASRILLPRDAFGRDGSACDWDLFELKARYETASHELIARRMLDFPPSIIVTIFDHRRRTFRRGNLPFRAPAWTELEQQVWRVAHDRSQAGVECDFTRRVQAWPIHEPDWKREILRTEWLGGDAYETSEGA